MNIRSIPPTIYIGFIIWYLTDTFIPFQGGTSLDFVAFLINILAIIILIFGWSKMLKSKGYNWLFALLGVFTFIHQLAALVFTIIILVLKEKRSQHRS
jgi:hypothetical protein